MGLFSFDEQPEYCELLDLRKEVKALRKENEALREKIKQYEDAIYEDFVRKLNERKIR